MKKKIAILLGLGVLAISNNVYAQEKSYYENNLGVSFTEQEYNFISNLYWEGYQEYITVDEYDEIKENDLFDKRIEKETTINYPLTRATGITSNLRTTSISRACSSKCMVTLVTNWNGTPTIKSYDVIGARVSGIEITTISNARVVGNDYIKTYSSKKTFSNGFGFSVLLPDVGNLVVNVTFYTTKGGNVYGSYQHAVKNTTKAISNQYSSLSANGFGGVFDFTDTAKSVYDNANGVSISV